MPQGMRDIIGIMHVIKEEPHLPKFPHPCCYIGNNAAGNDCSTIKASNGHIIGRNMNSQTYAIWFGRFMYDNYLIIAPETSKECVRLDTKVIKLIILTRNCMHGMIQTEA